MSPIRRTAPGRISRTRLLIFAAALFLWAGCVVNVLIDLQVRRTDQMRELARRQQQQIIPADPRRGTIFDRMGRELAVSIDVYSIYAASGEMKDPAAAANLLAGAIDLPPAQITAKLNGDGFALLRRRAAPDVADRVRELNLSGVHLIAESKRFYPRGSLAAHVLGFVVPDEPKLREGLERRYDAEIRGTPGALVAMRDARGSHFFVEARQEPVAGNDLVVSLDEVIQHIAERELAAAVEETGAISGTVVVLHTPTGEVLAMASQPTFNPNHYGASDTASRRNRAVTDVFEPGSTFKIVTAAAALEEGLVRPSEAIDCQNGLMRVAGISIHDHKPFGILSFADVIAQSSDVGVMKIAMRIDPRTFHDYISRFGFGSRTGVDLPGESRGLLEPEKKWAATSEAYISFGQEIGVTSLQIASAFSTVANRGNAVAPRVVTRVVEEQGLLGREPERAAPRRAISAEAADTLIDLLERVVSSGTGKRAAVPGYRVAGKTGTAQKIVNRVYSPDKHISSFCGFVPSRRPILTILVVLDEPKGPVYHGGDVAAPVFRRIAEPALDYLGVAPDDPSSLTTDLAMLGAGMLPPGGNGERGKGRTVPATFTSRPGDARTAHGIAGTLVAGVGGDVAGPGGAPGIGAEGAAGQESNIVEPAIVAVAPRPLTFDDDGATSTAPQEGAVTVPDLDGAPLRDAAVALARAGLVASVQGDGFVVSQIPASGSVVSAGSIVSLKLGRYIERVPAPAPAIEITPAREGGAARAPSVKRAARGKVGGGGGRAAHES